MFTVDAADLPEESLADNGKKQKVIKKIPQSAMENCKGIAVSDTRRQSRPHSTDALCDRSSRSFERD